MIYRQRIPASTTSIRPFLKTLEASIGKPTLQNRHHHQRFYASIGNAIISLGGPPPQSLVLTRENIRCANEIIEKALDEDPMLWIGCK